MATEIHDKPVEVSHDELAMFIGDLYVAGRKKHDAMRAMQAKYIEASNKLAEMKRFRDSAIEEIEAMKLVEYRLRGDLMKYGEHLPGCPHHPTRFRPDSMRKCTCGLAQAATETDAEREVEPPL